jgi:hypothetical protein
MVLLKPSISVWVLRLIGRIRDALVMCRESRRAADGTVVPHIKTNANTFRPQVIKGRFSDDEDLVTSVLRHEGS